MARFNIFRNGKVHIQKQMCDTCIFRPGNLMRLQPGTVEELVAGSVKNNAAIPCHQTLGGGNSVCRGFFDRHKTGPLQIAERLGIIEVGDLMPSGTCFACSSDRCQLRQHGGAIFGLTFH